jgi:hypothetical protein
MQVSALGAFQVEFVVEAPEERVLEVGTVDWGTHPTSNQTAAPTIMAAMEPITRPFTDQSLNPVEPLNPKFVSSPFFFLSMNSTMATMIYDSLQLNFSAMEMQSGSESTWGSTVSYWHFSEAHLEVLSRFRERTSLTIGMKSMAPTYRDLLCTLALTVHITLFSYHKNTANQRNSTLSSCTCS